MVLEGFATVDEDYRDFVGELTTELFVGVDVYVLPGEPAAAVKFGEGFFDDFAEVAALARVNHDLAEFRHCGEFSKGGWVCSSFQQIHLIREGSEVPSRNLASYVSTV